MWINYVPLDDETTPAPTVTVKAASPRNGQEAAKDQWQ
jgi:hypothetical protein